MNTITLAVPRQQVHSASDTAKFIRVSLPKPPFPLDIDAARADTAPRQAPIRNAALTQHDCRVGGWRQELEYQWAREVA